MEQHAIPQQISSYQFRLVGDMTLKQFFQLAGGILVGLLFYSSPLLGIIKWPFAIVSVILGIALAFMPLEERPLERWIYAFFRAIYSPTLYYWKKATTPPKFFQDEVGINPNQAQEDAALQSYLGKGAKKEGPLENLELAEKGFLSQLANIFSGAIPQPQAAPAVSPVPVVQTVQNLTPLGNPTQPVGQVVQPEQQGIRVPETEAIKIAQEGKPKLVIEEKVPDATASFDIHASQAAPVIAGNEMISTRAAVFSIDAAPPNPPTIPNVIVGQVIDQDRRIIEGAIMEVRDTSGRPIRALRSNKLGHFVTVTPLESGRYEILADKDGFEFSPVSFEMVGTIVPPILVQGKRIVETAVQPASVAPVAQNPVGVSDLGVSQI